MMSHLIYVQLSLLTSFAKGTIDQEKLTDEQMGLYGLIQENKHLKHLVLTFDMTYKKRRTIDIYEERHKRFETFFIPTVQHMDLEDFEAEKAKFRKGGLALASRVTNFELSLHEIKKIQSALSGESQKTFFAACDSLQEKISSEIMRMSLMMGKLRTAIKYLDKQIKYTKEDLEMAPIKAELAPYLKVKDLKDLNNKDIQLKEELLEQDIYMNRLWDEVAEINAMISRLHTKKNRLHPAAKSQSSLSDNEQEVDHHLKNLEDNLAQTREKLKYETLRLQHIKVMRKELNIIARKFIQQQKTHIMT